MAPSGERRRVSYTVSDSMACIRRERVPGPCAELARRIERGQDRAAGVRPLWERAANRAVVRFYNKRGTAEQWIKEGKQAAHWTRLSCHRFRANEVRLQLSVLTYNLGNLWRRLVLPARIATWSLTSL